MPVCQPAVLKYKNIFLQTKKQLDLRNQNKVYRYLSKIKPDAVIIASAKVGGIKANNDLKAEFIFDNLSIQNNLIDGSYKNGVKNGWVLNYNENQEVIHRDLYKNGELLSGEIKDKYLEYCKSKGIDPND